jgi:general secretion pathway protein H
MTSRPAGEKALPEAEPAPSGGCCPEGSGRLPAGFTLLELVVVVAILALATALVFPRLPAAESGQLRSSARSVASLLRYLGEKSATSKVAYRLHVNLGEGSLRVAQLANGTEIPPADPFLTRRVLGSGIAITDLELPRLGKVTTGEETVDFNSNGLGEFLIMRLKTPGGEACTIVAYPDGGKVKVMTGYQEVSR